MLIVMKNQEPQTKSAAIPLCSLDELPLGLGRAFNVEGRSIAVFRTRKGKLFAVDNRCPHKNGPLADGMLAGDQIVCPLHAFRFDGVTGECDQPGQCAVQAHEVTESDGIVSIRLVGSGR
ncbi:MAG TPA: nitrite reductase small subunit NirD [Phycisphaerae bacterium]|nr:nitrite reductase small subunit NirD [Phycisphaerae bacterium]